MHGEQTSTATRGGALWRPYGRRTLPGEWSTSKASKVRSLRRYRTRPQPHPTTWTLVNETRAIMTTCFSSIRTGKNGSSRRKRRALGRMRSERRPRHDQLCKDRGVLEGTIIFARRPQFEGPSSCVKPLLRFEIPRMYAVEVDHTYVHITPLPKECLLAVCRNRVSKPASCRTTSIAYRGRCEYVANDVALTAPWLRHLWLAWLPAP